MDAEGVGSVSPKGLSKTFPGQGEARVWGNTIKDSGQGKSYSGIEDMSQLRNWRLKR